MERYCAICRPLSYYKIKQNYLLVCSLVFAVIYNIPKFFEIRILEVGVACVSVGRYVLSCEQQLFSAKRREETKTILSFF